MPSTWSATSNRPGPRVRRSWRIWRNDDGSLLTAEEKSDMYRTSCGKVGEVLGSVEVEEFGKGEEVAFCDHYRSRFSFYVYYKIQSQVHSTVISRHKVAAQCRYLAHSVGFQEGRWLDDGYLEVVDETNEQGKSEQKGTVSMTSGSY